MSRKILSVALLVACIGQTGCEPHATAPEIIAPEAMESSVSGLWHGQVAWVGNRLEVPSDSGTVLKFERDQIDATKLWLYEDGVYVGRIDYLEVDGVVGEFRVTRPSGEWFRVNSEGEIVSASDSCMIDPHCADYPSDGEGLLAFGDCSALGWTAVAAAGSFAFAMGGVVASTKYAPGTPINQAAIRTAFGSFAAASGAFAAWRVCRVMGAEDPGDDPGDNDCEEVCN